MTRLAVPAGTSVPEELFAWQIRTAGLPEPEREHRFDPVRRWRMDFAWPALRVALEVEGGTFAAGRHVRGEGFARDCEKLNAAALAGWLVLRVTSAQVDDGQALTWAEAALALRGAS